MRATAIAAPLLILALGLSGCAKEVGPLGLGSRPSFELPTIDGRRLGPADYRGQVVLLDFMATWCGPCEIQSDVLAALEDEYPEGALQILAVDSGESFQRVREHFASQPSSHPVLVDADSAVADSFGIQGFPTLLLLDRSGEVVFTREGLTPPDPIRDALEAAGLASR